MNKLIAAAAAALLSLLALLAGSPAQAAASPTTAVTIRITHCNGCRISATSWMRLHTKPWASHVRTVRNGTVVFHVPKSRTKGLALTVVDMKSVNDGAVPVAVMRYAGLPARHAVTERQARTAKRGYPCWAGTSADRATLHFTVDHFPSAAVDGTKGYGIRVYADPSVHSAGVSRRTPRGVYETQDVPLCIG